MADQSSAANQHKINIPYNEGSDDKGFAEIYNEYSTLISNRQAEWPKIPKVPKMLHNLDKNNDCFDPLVVSIGPYHHGKPHLQEIENLKTEMALRYCGRFSGPGVSDLYGRGSDLYERVKDVASEARGFYDQQGLNNIDDKAFTKMMFLDGCFILEFIIMCLPKRGEEYHSNMIANVKRDLFLLENQLPYIVLEKLMEGHKEYEWEEMIKNFITMCRRLGGKHPAVKPEDKSPFHLLDMTRAKFVIQSATVPGGKHPAVKPEDKSPFHLLDMMRARFVIQSDTVPGGKSQIPETDDRFSQIPETDDRFSPNKTASDWYFYYPARVLKSMGIQFRPNKTGRFRDKTASDWYFYYPARVLKSMGIQFRPNKTGRFSDVKFESQLFMRGVLTLPPIRIDGSTKSLLLNLLAFESSCHNNSADSMQQGVVASFMCFMDSLIDNADDVMILRTQNVINNCLGNDQLVADLFNEIASNLVPNPRTYVEAKRGIQKHCENRLKKWMAEGHHIHFRNPWTCLALSGSLLLIVLTFAQTYLAAMQLK